ncbi:MAG: Uma2 family endonuclease [Microscillaceae bacterium]|jgi:Uma2 family endonuclease|nr:Uma2 family endonuclease [Microscillaceae bacterium]
MLKTLISETEYLAQEKNATLKSEYLDGEVVAMAGAQEAHNLIVANLIIELGNCLKKHKCRVYPSDFLLHIPQCNKYTYPDIIIACESPIFEKNDFGIDVLANPTVIIEVLSDSTEAYDRGKKFNCYKNLPSFKQYVLVATDEILVETYERAADDKWLLTSETKPEKTIKIGDCEILLEDIYNKMIWQ